MSSSKEVDIFQTLSPEYQSQDDFSYHEKSFEQSDSNIILNVTNCTASESIVGLDMSLHQCCLSESSIIKNSPYENQYLLWKSLQKTIDNQINEINESNFSLIIYELFQNNIVRSRGLLVSAVIKAQTASPLKTDIYAALISVINNELPEIGELIGKRLISSFQYTYKLVNQKNDCLATITFLGYLINRNVLHEIIALKILICLLENPTNNNVELASEVLKHCGYKLSQVNPQGLYSIFLKLKDLLNESSLDEKVQHMIKYLFDLEKNQFQTNSLLQSNLVLVDKNKQYTHILTLDYPYISERMLDIFQYDEEYEANEEQYKQIQKKILNKLISNTDKLDDDGNDSRIKESAEETNSIIYHSKIQSIIESSVSVDECAHQFYRMNLSFEQKMEICQIIFRISIQNRTFERFFGLLGQQLCLLNYEYVQCFEENFRYQYNRIHILENIRIKIAAKFFGYLLFKDVISWHVLSCIDLIKERTKPSSCFYIKTLFIELIEILGFNKLKKRLHDPTLIKHLEGLFPRNNPQKIQLCIDFFASINLSGLTDDLY